jgi:hypothetical protein
LRQALRRAVEHGVLAGDQTAGTYRFRHTLLAEAIYGTLLPGEREAEAVAGLAEALQHLEWALKFWDLVPEAPELVGLDLAALLVWTVEVASEMGAGPRAVAPVRRAIAL